MTSLPLPESFIACLPDNSFEPKLLRSGNGVAEKPCHAVACATQFGLTQVLGVKKIGVK